MAESKLTKVGYELESINIVQAPISDIEHRSECDPKIDFYGRKVYPVIVAPMGSVTDENNYKIWLDHNFICCVPRTVDYEKRLKISKETFASFSLSEADKFIINDDIDDGARHFICVDIAHGTMASLYRICKLLKERFGDNVIIMTGNVANPDAFTFYADAGIDFMRACVGTGSRCTTSCNVGVHYPTATLIDELRMRKEDWDFINGTSTQIIADGGIANFDDIQKCIALGAFGVMSGSIFAKAQEACEPIVFLHPDNLDMADAIPAEEYYEKLQYLKDMDDKCGSNTALRWKVAYEKLSYRMPYRLYYGMSTKLAQKKTGGKGNVTAEGIARPIPVQYPIAKWADNMESYMKSCMSYTGCRTIEEMRTNTELIINLSGDRSFRK